MKFIGLEPITTKPQIEIIRNRQVWDLHNAADFIDYQYDRKNKTLQLTWDYGCDCDGIIGGKISLKFHEVSNADITEADPDIPRSEDQCLESISLTNQNTVRVEFRGGQVFNVSCSYVVFDSNGTSARHQMLNNQELIKNLIPLWYSTRLWAEDLLRRYLDLAEASDVLKPENRGKKTINGTNWMYRTHGVGVDIYKTEEVGGIDFDFDKPNPDPWEMKIFFRRQYNDGNINLELYRELFEDEDMLDKELAELLEPRT